jgi:hypothetical protein
VLLNPISVLVGSASEKMNQNKFPNNERLRVLVKESKLSHTQALALFNHGLGSVGYSINSWKAFFVKETSARFRPFKRELLAHAEAVFKVDPSMAKSP